MKTDSAHLILDLWMLGEWSDSWVKQIEDIVEAEFTVVKKSRHNFVPHGETVAFILSESHFTLHSYPEENYISFDIYICKPDFDFVRIVRQIEKFLPISKIYHRSLRRGDYALPWLSRWKSSEKGLFAATFILASCSLLYELMLAQTLSTILGDTAHRYNVTIGMYIASMGLGALLYEKSKIKKLIKSLVKVEFLLILIGGLAPFLSIILDSFFREHTLVLSIILHSLIVTIGVLSGFELPLLMDIGESKKKGMNTIVLGVDYVGTLFGAIVFPIFLVPMISLFGISTVVATFNSIVALYLVITVFKNDRLWSMKWLVLIGLTLAVAVTGWLFESDVSSWLVSKFYLGKM